MEKILITGGAGYIGSHQVKMMCDEGYDVIVVDNLETGFEDAVDHRAKLIIEDIRNTKELTNILISEKINTIIHFAAYSLVGESNIDPWKYYSNNVAGTISLTKAMIDANVKNIVFSSSAAIYGDGYSELINEEDQKNPSSVYGRTKLIMEELMYDLSKNNDIKYVALRYFNAAGNFDGLKERHVPETHLIPLIVQELVDKNGTLKIFGNDYPTEDGTCVRDYIHVFDLCNAHIKAVEYLNSKETNSNYFNLGYSKGISVLEVIKKVEEMSAETISYKLEERRIGDPASLIADNKKAMEHLNWEPKKDSLAHILGSLISKRH